MQLTSIIQIPHCGATICPTHLRLDGHGSQPLFAIDDHYNVLAPSLKIYPTILFYSQQMTNPLKHLVCEIRENDTSFSHKLLQRMTPLHFCHEIPRFPKYEYILPNGHCVLTQLVYQLTNGIISKLRYNWAQKHHLHSLIHTISAFTNTPKLHN